MKRFRLDVILFLLFLFLNISPAQINELRIISPNGGETLTPNNRYGISWISQGVEKVNILYSIGEIENWIQIVEGVSAELGQYSWKIPTDITTSLKIKIENYSQKNLNDASDNFVQISYNHLKKALAANDHIIKILPLGNSITFDGSIGLITCSMASISIERSSRILAIINLSSITKAISLEKI